MFFLSSEFVCILVCGESLKMIHEKKLNLMNSIIEFQIKYLETIKRENIKIGTWCSVTLAIFLLIWTHTHTFQSNSKQMFVD